jgi:ABC-type transport system involved in cytochrome c biogenesis ATPase subunit
MKISEMIEVLQAAERGEVIESTTKMFENWTEVFDPVFDFHRLNYRIAPKKEMTLVERLRGWTGKDMHDAADRIEELEKNIALLDLHYVPTDDLLAEIARRVK